MRSFAFFSANLHQLLPDIPYEEHANLFRQADRYGKLALDTSHHRHGLDSLSWPSGTLPDWARPGIVATFHTGPYRLLPMWLARKGLPITVLLAADIAAAQHVDYEQARHLIETTTGKPINYQVLHAENPLVLRQLLRALQQGRFVVIYVDGQLGAAAAGPGRLRDTHGTLELDFMGRPMRVRTGVAELARLSGRPIYPWTMSFDAADQPVLHPGPVLSIPAGPRDPAIIQQVMEQLYAYLAQSVSDRPMQWEGWYYVHHDLTRARSDAKGGMLRHYLPFCFADRYFLLHKDSLTVQVISSRVYQKLASFIDL